MSVLTHSSGALMRMLVPLVAISCWTVPAQVRKDTASPPPVSFRAVSILDNGGRVGGEAYRILAPVGWRVAGGIVWKDDPANPAQPWIRLSGPNGQEIGVLPPLTFVWNPQTMRFRFPPGSTYACTEVQPPVLDPFQCIQRFIIPRYLRSLAAARVVRQESLPELASVGRMKYPGPEYRNAMFRAGKERFAFVENGIPMEADVYLLTAAVQFPVGPTMST